MKKIKKMLRKILDYFKEEQIYVNPITGNREEKSNDSVKMSNNSYLNYKKFLKHDDIRTHLYD